MKKWVVWRNNNHDFDDFSVKKKKKMKKNFNQQNGPFFLTSFESILQAKGDSKESVVNGQW